MKSGSWNAKQFARHQEESQINLKIRIATGLARKVPAPRPARIYKPSQSVAGETARVDAASPATVLVVDDDPSTLRSLKRLVSAFGFKVKTFGRPSELLASKMPRSKACMVVDIDMPEMNGIEMCEVLKRSGRGLPTVLITGRTDARTRLLTVQSDAIAVLFKPFDDEALLDAIGRALALSTKNRSEI